MSTHQTPDDGLIRLTGHELLVLISLNEGPPAARTREYLRLPTLEASSPLMAAGLSTLIVRGLVEVDGDQVAPVGNVLPLTRMLTIADRWVEAAAIGGEVTNAALLVGSRIGSAVLEPRPFGIWDVRPLSAADDLSDAASRFVRAAFGQLTDRPFGGSIKVMGDGAPRTSAIRIDESGSWEMTSGVAGEEPAPVPVEADPTFAVLADAVRV